MLLLSLGWKSIDEVERGWRAQTRPGVAPYSQTLVKTPSGPVVFIGSYCPLWARRNYDNRNGSEH